MSVGELPFQREITQLCSEHHAWLLTWLWRKLDCRQSAADLAQDIYNSPHGGDEELSQDANWLVDLMTQYQVSKNLSATLNVNNIFDKSYYTNIGFHNSAAYGEPRNFMVITHWNF